LRTKTPRPLASVPPQQSLSLPAMAEIPRYGMLSL
jgi:hypothetical protein